MVDSIQNQIDALEQELEGLEQRGDKKDRVTEVKKQLKHYKDLAAKRDDITGEALDALAVKRAAADRALAADRAAELAGRTTPNTPEAANALRPALSATTDEWRTFAARPDVDLGTGPEAGHDEIVAAYITKYSPAGDASEEHWVKYATDHGVNVEGKTPEEARAAIADAGWAQPIEAATPMKRNTQQNKPQQNRG